VQCTFVAKPLHVAAHPTRPWRAQRFAKKIAVYTPQIKISKFVAGTQTGALKKRSLICMATSDERLPYTGQRTAQT